MDPLARQFVRFRDDGDLRALGAVFDELAPRLLAVALHLTGRQPDAEDALQQAFLLAMERAGTFDAGRRLEPWLAGILTNVARNSRRRSWRESVSEVVDAVELADADPDPAASAERNELEARLRRHVDELPQEQRQVLLLRLQHGMSPAEIADVLGVPAGTVRMRIHRGQQALRRVLPVGLAALCGLDLPARGLFAIRAEVLQAATPHAATVTGVTTWIGASLVMKKLIAAVVVLFACGLLWWGLTERSRPVPDGVPPPASPPSAVVAGPDGGGTVAAAEPSLRREAAGELLTQATGALRVNVGSEIDGVRVPMPGMLVELWPGEAPTAPFAGGLLLRRSDARGEVELPRLAAGPWRVRLPADNKVAVADVDVPADDLTTVELTMTTEKVLRGLVVDSDGAAVAGAELWVFRGTYMGRDSLPERGELVSRCAGTSGADGRFVVPVAARESRIAATHPAYADSMGRYCATRVKDVLLVMGRLPGSLTVSVRDDQGAAIADALVTLEPPGRDARRSADGLLLAPRVPRTARTDEAGRCNFVGLAPGEQQVTANAYPNQPNWSSVVIEPSAHAEIALELSAGISIIGTVRTADGTPARVRVVSRPEADTNGHYSECDTRSDGSFVLPYQPCRSLFVVAKARGGRLAAQHAIVDPVPGIVHCDLVLDDLVAVDGVALGEDGSKLAGWYVRAKDATGAVCETESRADGSFTLLACTAGTRTYSLAPPDAEERAVLELTDIPGDGPIELRVSTAALPSAQVSGRLVAADGMPVAGRTVRLRTRSEDWKMSVDTGDDGTFAFRDLSANRMELTCYFAGNWIELRGDLQVEHAKPCRLGDLVLAPMATLDVNFVHADGTPWAGDVVGVDLVREDGTQADISHSFVDGALRVQAAPGSYRLGLNATDLVTAPQHVVLIAEKPTTVTVPLTIARTCRLRFNFDGARQPTREDELAVEVRSADGTLVLEEKAKQLPDLRGFRYWYSRTVLPFGRYTVEANGEGGYYYGCSFELGADFLDSDIDVPRR